MRKCMVQGRLKYFHKWSDLSNILPSNGQMIKMTVGIVEDLRYGDLDKVSVSEIRFVDIPDGEFYMPPEEIDRMEKDILEGNIGKIHDGIQCTDKCTHCGVGIYKHTLSRDQFGFKICRECHKKVVKGL